MTFSIRAKLMLLVGLPAILLAVAIPILSETEHEDLVDAADDHVEDAERAFKAEVTDDLQDLDVVARTIAESRAVQRAIVDNSPEEALAEIAFVGKSGLHFATAHLPKPVLGQSDVRPALLEQDDRVWVDVLISDVTYQEVKDIVLATPIEELTVEGRAEPVRTYSVTGIRT
jgi:hypothetical protein